MRPLDKGIKIQTSSPTLARAHRQQLEERNLANVKKGNSCSKRGHHCEILSFVVLFVLSALSRFWYIMIVICAGIAFLGNERRPETWLPVLDDPAGPRVQQQTRMRNRQIKGRNATPRSRAWQAVSVLLCSRHNPTITVERRQVWLRQVSTYFTSSPYPSATSVEPTSSGRA